jgi:hypothetical protein
MSVARFVGIGLLAVVAMVAGCGRPSGPSRYDVSGTVTFRGQPVPSGSIAFEPDASRGNSGPVSVMSIIDGRFDSRATHRPGPLSGPLVVRITGYPPPDPSVEVQPPLFPEHATSVDLPASRNVTELAFEVPEAHGKVPARR